MNRPNRNAKPGDKPAQKSDKAAKYIHLKQIAQMTLGSGNMSLAVSLPSGQELNEWLAFNSIQFFNQISMLYGTLTQFCTKQSCPLMSAGQKFQYLWADGQNFRTPLKVPAPQYIQLLMNWVQAQFNNQKLYPCQPGIPFPPNFVDTVKTIFKRLFRVYAHIYHTHFKIIMALDQKQMEPLEELIQQFKLRKQS